MSITYSVDEFGEEKFEMDKFDMTQTDKEMLERFEGFEFAFDGHKSYQVWWKNEFLGQFTASSGKEAIEIAKELRFKQKGV